MPFPLGADYDVCLVGAHRLLPLWMESASGLSRRIVYLVPLGFVPVLVCSTMPNRTCVEQKTGAPVGYVTEL